jgi:hypothetical protein
VCGADVSIHQPLVEGVDGRTDGRTLSTAADPREVSGAAELGFHQAGHGCDGHGFGRWGAQADRDLPGVSAGSPIGRRLCRCGGRSGRRVERSALVGRAQDRGGRSTPRESRRWRGTRPKGWVARAVPTGTCTNLFRRVLSFWPFSPVSRGDGPPDASDGGDRRGLPVAREACSHYRCGAGNLAARRKRQLGRKEARLGLKPSDAVRAFLVPSWNQKPLNLQRTLDLADALLSQRSDSCTSLSEVQLLVEVLPSSLW